MSVRFLSGVNVDSNTLVVDDVNNRVGIGTASPGTILEVSSATPIFRISSSLNSSFHGIEFRNGGALDAEIKQLPETGEFRISNGRNSSWGGFITLYTDTAERMRITSAGNVGIGTTSPSEKLDVNGNGRFLNSVTTFAGSSGYYGRISTEYNYPYIETFIDSIAAASWDGRLVFRTNSNAGGTTTGMVIDPFGKVGIGTTTPAVKFVVSNAGASGFEVDPTGGVGSGPVLQAYNRSTSAYMAQSYYALSHTFNVGSGGSTRAVDITSAGNVGIGTTAPQDKLTVKGATNYNLNLGLLGGYSGIYVYNDASSAYNHLRIDASPLLLNSYSGGNVGIGTTSPNAKLEVNGAITFSSVDTFGQLVVKTASGATGDMLNIGVDTANSVAFIQSVERGVDVIPLSLQRYGGNVGIGTTTPVSPLDVNGIISSRGIYIAQNSGTYNLIYNASNSIAMYLGGSADPGNYYDNTTHYFRSSGGGTYYAIINSSGNVGIGTTSPAQMLHVTGNGLFNGNLDVGQGVSTQDSAINVGAGRTGNGYAYIDLIGDTTYTDYALRIIRNNSGANALSQIIHRGTGDFSLSTNEAANLTFGTSASERMRITASGNVGIGTTSPGAKLHVDDSSADAVIRISKGASTIGNIDLVNEGNRFSIQDDGVRRFVIDTSGNVGIGTTSPAYKLEVVGGSVNTQIARFITADYPTHSVGLGVDAQASYWGASIFQDDVKRFTVDSTGGILVGENYQGSNAPANGAAIEGNVGIGTTSPSTKLDVIGTGVFGTMTTSRGSYSNGLSLQNNGGQATSLFLWQDGVASAHIGSPANSTSLHIVNSYNTGLITDPNAIVLDNTGNVGIGTTSPSSKLQSNTSSTYNSATPSGAIIASNLSGGNAIIDIGVDTSYLGYIQSRNILNTTAYNLLLNPIGGNVGIGTTSPGKKLDILQSSDSSYAINIGNSARYTYIGYSDTYQLDFGATGTNDNVRYGVFSVGGGVATFHTNGSERMRITSAGDVGIGTTSPAAKLHVYTPSSGSAIVVGRATGNSSIKASADANGGYLSLDSTGGATIINHYAADDVWLVTGGGNLGIGTSGPTQRVHVNGNVRVTGAYYDSNNSAGSSGQVLSSTGSGTDWVSLSEITGVDGTGTANYIAKWSDTDTITNSQVFDNGTNVGINNASPKTRLDINGAIGFGSKSMSMTDTFAAALTINMNDHNGCYVKITAFGDWSNHSTIAYLGEFFIQASAGAYNEPGIIIRQVDNTSGGDDIQAQILDPAGAGTRDFIIELKATSSANTPFTAYLQYEVRGQYNSVS